MKPLNFFLAPYAYYVRLNLEDYEDNHRRGSLQKWIDNRKGKMLYDFVEFKILDDNLGLDFPKRITKLGLISSSILCYQPFDYETSISNGIFVPESIVADSNNELHFFFSKGQSSKLYSYMRYYTQEGHPYIEKISYCLDESGCNLNEIVSYSNGSRKIADYHLIAKSSVLQKGDWYALFDL